MNGCQCIACQFIKHDSDCAVHNEPAYPNEACNCSKLKTRQSSDELAENLQSLAKGTNNQFLAQVAYRMHQQRTRITELEAQLADQPLRVRAKSYKPRMAYGYSDIITELQAQLEAAKKDAAIGKYCIENGGWRRFDDRTEITIPVAKNAFLCDAATRRQAIDAAIAEGKA